MRLAAGWPNRRSDRDGTRRNVRAHELFYDNVDRRSFETDFQEKHWVILLQDPVEQCVRGFSTQLLLHVTCDGRPMRALFSGDTIVHNEYWARNPLAHIWGHLAMSLMENANDDPLFWFLTTKGYKTYRYLPVFFHEFYLAMTRIRLIGPEN